MPNIGSSAGDVTESFQITLTDSINSSLAPSATSFAAWNSSRTTLRSRVTSTLARSVEVRR
jgi:hypothetical protein